MKRTVLFLGLALAACGDSGGTGESYTGVRLVVKFDPHKLRIDQLRVEGQLADTGEEAFTPGLVPNEPGDVFETSPQSVVILLPDSMNGKHLRIHVYGLRQGEAQGYGQTTVEVVSGSIVPATVQLADKVPSCGDGDVTPGLERCDPRADPKSGQRCPAQESDCDDGDACTQDVFHDDGPCQAWCESTPITECRHGDGCCPTGCGPANDADCESICGDGLVSTGELCDTRIQPGQPGSCPTQEECVDANPCTQDRLVAAGTCQAHCEHDIITQPIGNDGCCPEGENATTDIDCPSVCGNGVLEPGENCDIGIQPGQPGACPTDCEDENPCTLDTLYDANSCMARCVHTEITTPADGDGCCPNGADATLDSDCPSICGNGVVEPGELCDKAIQWPDPGSCPRNPADCDDDLSCTEDQLTGSDCTAQCTHTDITACRNGDGCCPTTCDDTNDSDCNLCGNGQLDPGENCDTAIPSGDPGACPTDCTDSDPCTIDTLTAAGTCDATCLHEAPACDPDNSDNCCPDGCNANTDKDCEPVCGNGVLEPGENCDTAIPAGDFGSCPTSCDDGNSCTADSLTGEQCSTECVYSTITDCNPGDGCCPDGCEPVQDSGDTDCPGCGNGIVESDGPYYEECDDGANNAVFGDCTTSCTTNTGSVGDPCRDASDCTGINLYQRTCATDGSDIPNGYCTKTCAGVGDCPAGSACTNDLDLGLKACVELCERDADCRWAEGYSCKNIGNNQKACLP